MAAPAQLPSEEAVIGCLDRDEAANDRLAGSQSDRFGEDIPTFSPSRVSEIPSSPCESLEF